MDNLLFFGEKGNFIIGPRLNPIYNKKMFSSLEKILNTNVGSRKLIENLRSFDFEDKTEFEYQDRICYEKVLKENFLETAKFSNSELTPYLFSSSKAILPLIGLEPTQVKIKGLHKGYQMYSEFDFETVAFQNTMKKKILKNIFAKENESKKIFYNNQLSFIEENNLDLKENPLSDDSLKKKVANPLETSTPSFIHNSFEQALDPKKANTVPNYLLKDLNYKSCRLYE